MSEMPFFEYVYCPSSAADSGYHHCSAGDVPRKESMHMHDFCELALVRSGRFTVMSEDMQMTISAPCLEIFRKNCLHAQFDLSNTPYERYLVRLVNHMPASLESLVQRISRSAVRSITVIPLSADQIDWLFQILRRLEHLSEQENLPPTDERFLIPLRCLLEEINRICMDQESLPALNGDMNILYVLNYIREHLTEKLTVDAVAAYMHCGKTKLSAAFRRYTGISVHQYILEERLSLSLEYMKKPYSVSDIAALCGFCDSAHYIRTFQKSYGMTPAKYRELHPIRETANVYSIHTGGDKA